MGEAARSAEEQGLRQQLCDFYHLVDFLGWHELIFNHISVRLPGPERQYLVNPFGLNYFEITPDNLIKVDISGQLAEPSNYMANPAGFALHGVIHANREDVGCVAHTHTDAVSAVAMKQAGIGHDNFYGAQLLGRVGYHDFEGITLRADEGPRILASLGDRHVLVLRNHGVAVCERDIPATFQLLWTVQRAAQIQCMSEAMAGEDIVLDPEIQTRCREATAYQGETIALSKLVFDGAVRRMRAAQQRT